MNITDFVKHFFVFHSTALTPVNTKLSHPLSLWERGYKRIAFHLLPLGEGESLKCVG